ncbi:MAG: hypothetical protein F6K17_10095 [Okeania sp. SIO3C4]|nr:hypothetical protein [Okeania sp. SIO3C4]
MARLISSCVDTFLKILAAPLQSALINCPVAERYKPFLETYDYLHKSMIFSFIICSIPASTWQRRRYPAPLAHAVVRASVGEQTDRHS